MEWCRIKGLSIEHTHMSCDRKYVFSGSLQPTHDQDVSARWVGYIGLELLHIFLFCVKIYSRCKYIQ